MTLAIGVFIGLFSVSFLKWFTSPFRGTEFSEVDAFLSVIFGAGLAALLVIRFL